MKIIDLLNKIANGDEVPKMITSSDIEECEDMIFIYDKDMQDYKTKDGDFFFETAFNKGYPVLNLEVEIIEEEKEIEPLDKNRALIGGGTNETMLFLYCTDLETKLNEIIEAVNELRKEK